MCSPALLYILCIKLNANPLFKYMQMHPLPFFFCKLIALLYLNWFFIFINKNYNHYVRQSTELISNILVSVIVCCPENTYGPNCKSCPGGTKSPCNGNGKCDVSGFSLFMNLNQTYSILFEIIALHSNLKTVCNVKHVQQRLDVSAIFILNHIVLIK